MFISKQQTRILFLTIIKVLQVDSKQDFLLTITKVGGKTMQSLDSKLDFSRTIIKVGAKTTQSLDRKLDFPLTIMKVGGKTSESPSWPPLPLSLSL